MAFVMSACGSSDPGPTTIGSSSVSTTTTLAAETSRTNPPSDLVRLVEVGDSIPFESFCVGCEGFVDQYAASLEVNTNRPVEVMNRSRNDGANLADINKQLVQDSSLREQLTTANVVIVSVGFNDQSPWPNDLPCGDDGGTALATKIAAILEYSDSCIEQTIESYRPAYESAFGEISTLVPEPRVLTALNVYNIVPGHPGVEAIASREELDKLNITTKGILDKWNDMLCETAGKHEFICVDVYGSFNGVDGTTPAGSNLESDYTHPSQSGNDLIAALLREIDVSKLAGDN